MIASKSAILAIAFLAALAHATSEASTFQMTSMAALKAMEKVFARSDKVHSTSMAAIMKGMSTKSAWSVLEKGNLTSPALIQMTSQLRVQQSNLRKGTPGYDGIAGAKKLLNSMIYESMMKYDAEIAKCTEFYSMQCAAMETCRGQISQCNYVAANARTLILDSQACINRCEIDIPTKQYDLKVHNRKCDSEHEKMKKRLSTVQQDLEVMTKILELTDCKAPQGGTFAQMKVLRCKNSCSKKSFISFDHNTLKQQVSQLQSPVAQKLMQEGFGDLFEGIKAMQSLEFLQLGAQQSQPVVNQTQFYNPPVPRTEDPADPCTEYADGGGPTGADIQKGREKCTITDSPQCYKLQERFLLIQSGIRDEEGDLKDAMDKLKRLCDETRDSLEAQIKDDQELLSECQTKLGFSTEKEATAAEECRQTDKQHTTLSQELKEQMKSCSKNYIQFESEICAFKKIRAELYKIKGANDEEKVAYFTDCEVSEWEPDDCSQSCKHRDGPEGEQHLSRNVLVHSSGGAKCLPLAAIRKCNLNPCAVDCKLDEWHGWSKCSAECGGGVKTRLRDVKVAAAWGGKPCGAETETIQCNAQACEEDCTLTEWSGWSHCSKDCDGGTRKRSRQIAAAPKGTGKCPGAWDKERLEYKPCNMFSCIDPLRGKCNIYHHDPQKFYTCNTLPACCEGYLALGTASDKVQCLPQDWTNANNYKTDCGPQPMKCNKKLDVVFLLDGSGSLGTAGWNAEIAAAQTFVKAFSGAGAQADMAVTLYSGPSTWSGVYKCIGKNVKDVNMESDCKVKTVTHWSHDMAGVSQKIKDLKWPQGSTLTSLALMQAKAELGLGRKDAESVVVVMTDGKPLSFRSTLRAARQVRKVARLVWVPVTANVPLRQIKRMATRRWQENIVVVKNFADLKKVSTVDHVIASICPVDTAY